MVPIIICIVLFASAIAHNAACERHRFGDWGSAAARLRQLRSAGSLADNARQPTNVQGARRRARLDERNCSSRPKGLGAHDGSRLCATDLNEQRPGIEPAGNCFGCVMSRLTRDSVYLLRGGQPPDGRGFNLPSTGAGLAERRCMQSHVASRPAEGYDEGPGDTGELVSRENGPLMRCVGRFWLVSG